MNLFRSASDVSFRSSVRYFSYCDRVAQSAIQQIETWDKYCKLSATGSQTHNHPGNLGCSFLAS